MNNKKQRNRLFTMLLLVMAILMPYGGAWAQTASLPSEGDGKTGNPYIITKAEELAWFRDQVNSGNNFICAKISEDVEVIDMSTVCHAEDKSQNLEELSWKPIGKNDYGYQYRGTFDGNGKTITNLYINASQNNVGLFGYTMEGTIKNLTFEYANVTNTKTYTGILVGYANNSNLQNIKISNTCQIKGGKETGGIAGDFWGNAYNCVNYATVQGKERVGGLLGYCTAKYSSITTCANYGNVTATGTDAGGLVGYFISGTIQDCANYGDVKGTERVAGMAGYVNEGKIQNVFSYGCICATQSTQDIGMAFGNSDYGATEGMVAYYSGAKLTANSQEITIKAFGNGKPSEDNATGFTEAQLRNGVVAFQLQQNASSEAKWGQNLANDGDIYPVIGSEHTVYSDNSLVNCMTYEIISGSFTNNTTSSAIRYQHGQTINHHVATNATCTEAATKEYWQCQDCQRIYSDSQLTVELTDVTDAEHPALGHDNNDDGYCDRCQHYVAVKPSEENGVYQIAKPCHLAWFRDYVNGTIVDEGEAAGTTHPSASAMLIADIDLTNYCHAAEDGKELLSWIPVGNLDNPWKGNMDGQAHTISHLYIKTTQNDVGLFGCIKDATIQDLIFDNAKVENVSTTNTNTVCTGILAGCANAYVNSYSAHIKGIKTTDNCTVIGQDETGGIVGDTQINLENCENHSSVKGTRCVGGIVGYSLDTNIKRCTNYGTVVSDNNYIGGIIGDAQFASIEDCANYGKISSTGWYTGGIAGQTFGRIQNVFSYGDVTNTNDNPGIIIGNVEGTLTAKGIVAYNRGALLNNSFVNINNIVGEGRLTFEDGKEEADVVKAFTKQQIKSGEVAWLLNGSTSAPTEGSTLAWYQKLGENGDAYPVLTSTGENTVHSGYQHGSKESFFSNNNQHSAAYNAEAEDEANGNHDKTYQGAFTWADNEDKTNATVTATFTCKVCGKIVTPEAMTVEHDAEHVNVEATCTEDGHKYYKTSYAFNAKAIFSNAYTQTLPALGHNMSGEVTFNDSKHIYQKGCTRNCGHNEYFATSDASVAAQPNDDTSAFTVDKFTLNDATAYDSKAEFTVTNLEYTRSFSHDKWLAVYVPFSIDCGQLTDEYEMATINNFHEFEQKDGKYNIVLEVKPVTNGTTIPALTPCLIRMKQAPETAEAETTEAKTLQFTNVSFAAAADKKIDCASVTRYYQFLGTLNAKTGFDTTSDFVINEGELWKTGSDTELNPQRWYLNASDRTGSELNPSVQLSRIAIHVIGGDETTDIDGIYVKTDTEDVSSSRQGIYDLQGRKLSVEPTSGIYIKDGKKYVK